METKTENAAGPSTPANGSALSPFAEKVLAALRRLTNERVPHPCGGFNIDDLRWQMGLVFEPDDTMHEAIDELVNARQMRSRRHGRSWATAAAKPLSPTG